MFEIHLGIPEMERLWNDLTAGTASLGTTIGIC